MAGFDEAAFIISILGLVGGAASSDKQQQGITKARRQSRTTLNLQEKQQDLAIRQQRVAVRRQARAARAEALVTAQGQTGNVAGSGIQGAAGSITSQTGAALGYLDSQQGLTRQVTGSRQKTNNYQGTAAYYGSLADLSFGVFNDFGGFNTIFSAFKSKQKVT